MSLTPSSSTNRCPTCCDTKGNCRHHHEEGKHLCMTFADIRLGEVVNGYKCTAHFDLWAAFAIDNSQQWTEEQREKWHSEQRRKRNRQAKQHQEFLLGLLPIEQRSQQYRHIASKLPLKQHHQVSLKELRGLSDDEIDFAYHQGWIRSWEPGLQVDEVSPRLAGVNPTSIIPYLLGVEGISIAATDGQGHILGHQIASDDRDSFPKYTWLSSKARGGNSPHLPNGELPLFIWRHPEATEINQTWLVEGGLKSLIVALKLWFRQNRTDIQVIGASGANFNSSLETIKEALAVQTSKQVVLCPDAGSISNQNISKNYEKIIDELLTDYSVSISWWGQITKEHADIDELSTQKYSSIEYISVERFVSLCQKYGGIKPEKNVSQLDFNERVAEVQKKLHTLSYAADIECDPHQKYLPDLVDKIPHQGIVLLHAPMGSGKSVQIDKIKQYLCGGGYWEERPISNQISLIPDKQFVLPPTERIWHEGKKMRFLSINARIALGREQAIRWHFTWIEDADLDQSQSFEHDGETIQTATVLETIDEIGLCWDSLGKLFERDWSNTLVIIDELELGLNHVATSSTCRDRRSKILYTLEKKLKECLEGGGLVIGADANLTDSSYEYLTRVAPGHIPFIVKHNYIRPDSDKWDISFYTGKRDEILSQIENWLSSSDCEPIAVAIDNQSEAEGLANSLVKKYPWLKGEIGGLIRIDSKITQTDFGQNFVKRPNESIERYQPKILIYTPSLGVGCSIDIDYFSYVFGLFFGNLEPSQARQMLARVRKPIPRIMWCKDRASNTESESSSFLPSEIKRRMFEYNDTTTSLIEIALELAKDRTENLDSDREILPNLVEVLQGMMGKDGSWDNPHVDLYCNQLAKRNFSLSQLAIQLRQELIDEGHNVTDYAADEKTSAGDNVRASKEEIKQHKASMTAHAADITLDEAKDINRKPNPTDEEKYAATKAFLKEELPEVELTSDFLYKAVYADNRRWLNQVKLFWMCLNIDATKEIDKKHWKHKLKQFADGVAYLPDVKTYSGKVDIINKIGIFEVIRLDDFEHEYSEKDSSIKEWFTQKVLRHKKLIKNAFGITVSENTQIIKFINKLLGKVGLKLKRSRKDTDNITYYKLNEELVLDVDRLAVLEALTRRWELQLTTTVQSEVISQEPSATQPDTSDHEVIQVENEWLQPGAIEEVAADLAACEDSETLQLIRQTEIPDYVLKAAAKTLPVSTQNQIRRWVLEQNQSMREAS